MKETVLRHTITEATVVHGKSEWPGRVAAVEARVVERRFTTSPMMCFSGWID